MNAAQAKQIPLEMFLARLGFTPARHRGDDFWYLSPLRQEQEPSFRVSARYNNWVDWGTGQRGDIISFAERHFGVDTSGALREIERAMGAVPKVAFRRQPEILAVPEHIEVRRLTSFALLEYARRRGIDGLTAKIFLDEVHYTHAGRAYYALGFGNASGGYELRSRDFKGTRGHKDITHLALPGREGEGAIAVFEGFMDFLSAVVMERLPATCGSAIVLNSTAMQERAFDHIGRYPPTAIYLFLDNDPGGQRLAGEFMTLDLPVFDQAPSYAGHKDLNDQLVARQRRR